MEFSPVAFPASTLGTAAFLNSGSSAGQLPTVPIPLGSMDLSVIAPIAFNAIAKTIGSDGTIVVTTGSYSNPTWITGLAYSKLSGAPTLGTAAAQNSGAFDAAGAAAAAQAASQPVDSDLTAIAALSTTTFGRALLTMANAAAVLSALGTTAVSVDTDWTANSTVGDKTAALASYSNGLNGTMVTALNVVSGGTGTAISAAFDVLVNVVKQLAAIRTALVAAKIPNV